MARKRRRNGDGQFSFDFSALTYGGNTEEEEEQIPKLSTEPVMFENAMKMAEEMDYSKDYFAIVAGTFIFGDFIEALCWKKRLMPSEVYVTTLGMSRNNIDSLVNLVDCLRVKHVNLIVSHYYAGTERRGLMPYMYQEFKGKPIDVAVLQSHCKIVLIYSGKGNVMIAGSANLSTSNNVEQFFGRHVSSGIHGP